MTRRNLAAFDGPNHTGELQLSFRERLVRRDLRVVRTEDVTPGMRRIVLGGDDARDFPLVRFAPGDHVKAYFPDPATGVITAYREVADGEWVVDGPGEPLRRDYTPRALDAATGELTLECVLHGHGVAGRWAQQASAGDPLVVIGPRANWLLPQDYGHYLALGDESALPAVARLIEEAPAGARVTAVVEVADDGEEQALSGAADIEIRWVHRETAPVAGGHVSALETTLHGLDLAGLDDLYVFAAGESGAMKPIRRHLRRELGLPKERVHVDGYWKRGVADHDHHVEEDD